MNSRSVALLASLALFAGCKTVHVLGPGQLQKLDGYDAADALKKPPLLETRSGEVVTFRPSDGLTFIRAPSRVGVHLGSSGPIQHLLMPRPDQLVATLVGGRSFSVDLQRVSEVRLVTPSPWKTTLLVVSSILLGGAAITGLAYLTVSLAHWNGRLSFGGTGFGGGGGI